MANPKIFISHISSETELAQLLQRHIEKDFPKIQAFVSSDGRSIKAGGKWLELLQQTLERTQLEIVLCSKESVGRPWVNFEAGAGWIRGIEVIPVCHSDMKPNDLPIPLSMLQAVEAGQPKSLQGLYEVIADTYGLPTPAVDFEAIASEIRDIEKKYKEAGETLERIKQPRVLCAASGQYSSIGFNLDVAALEAAFPHRITVDSHLTAKSLRDHLTGTQFDIVHLVVAVDSDNGDLIFTPLAHEDHKPINAKVDKMTSRAFAALIRESRTSLVFLATCDALFLAVDVARVANMIATNRNITGDEAAEWAGFFYGMLAKGKSVYQAYEFTNSQSEVPLRLIHLKDIAFAPESERP